MSVQDFLRKATLVHGDRYSYEKVEYKNNRQKILILCKIHGDFFQTPGNHLKGCGCPTCGNKRVSEHQKQINGVSTEEFIERSKIIHCNKYNYSDTVYENYIKKVFIGCPTHGSFSQSPADHLSGKSCKRCAADSLAERRRLSIEEFIKRASEIHADFYDYSKSKYEKSIKEIIIICPIHGEFFQTPHVHLRGCGCQLCASAVNVSEQRLLKLIKRNFPHEIIEYQARPDWLGRQSLDIYMPEHNIAIEYQGEQHFKPNRLFDKGGDFEKRIKLDKQKYQLCAKNKCELLYFSFTRYKDESCSIKPLIHDIETLFDSIIKTLK